MTQTTDYVADALTRAGIASVETRDVRHQSSAGIRVWEVQTITFTDGRRAEVDLWYDASGKFHHCSDARWMATKGATLGQPQAAH